MVNPFMLVNNPMNANLNTNMNANLNANLNSVPLHMPQDLKLGTLTTHTGVNNNINNMQYTYAMPNTTTIGNTINKQPMGYIIPPNMISIPNINNLPSMPTIQNINNMSSITNIPSIPQQNIVNNNVKGNIGKQDTQIKNVEQVQ